MLVIVKLIHHIFKFTRPNLSLFNLNCFYIEITDVEQFKIKVNIETYEI